MALLLVLLTTILAFSLASTDQCVSSPGSSIDLFLRSHKNASGDWIITVDTRRLTRKDNPREFSVNVKHETRICGRYEIEEHVSMAFVHSSLHDKSKDTSMPGPIEPSSTTTASTPSTATLSTTTATSSTATSTTSPKSCPHSGYQLYPGYNCYKAFPSRGEMKTWSEARERCMSDGGDLVVLESERQREDVYVPLYNSVSWDGTYDAPWVGVYIPQGGNDWKTVKGEPALSTWWLPGYPKKDAALKCAQAAITGMLKNINNCTVTRPFICEISL